ncbi:hypothetical protein BFC17_21455 [Alteromonas lipolytica]|uniref:HDOD domain-containing protein n=2 Tax=Alteromonas lipolytica TaxID=1856405 RepID=A0A1E8FDV1_9ALTE|nr:hypothetical protein BFC17_21455 [Alteromonas lipolytica]
MLATYHSLLRDSEALPVLPAKDTAQLSLYLDISARWLSFSKDHLPLLTVLTCRPYHASEPGSNLWLRHIGAYLLLGIRNRVNQHTLQQGTAALLAYHRLKQQSVITKPRVMRIIKQLNHFGQHYWAAHLLPSGKSKQYQDCFDVAWLWHRYLSRAPLCNFNDILQKLVASIPGSGQHLLAELIEYPGVIHEGMAVQLAGQQSTVVSQLKDKVLVYTAAMQQFSWHEKTHLQCRQRQTITVIDWLNINSELQKQPEEGEVISLGDHRWALPQSYPTARPPASLQALLRALNDPDIAIQKIVSLVTAEPAFSRFLNDAASKDNRMQLSVSNVKQSILTYGLERVGHMLVQYALYQRLTQHWFPLLEWYSQLAQITILLSSEMAVASGKITPQYASLVTTVALSPLFTTASEKGKTTPARIDQRLFDIDSLLGTAGERDKNTTRQRLISLATAWEQDKGQARLIACCGKLPEEVPGLLRLPHCISGLSLIWAREWLFGHTACQHTQQFIQQTNKAFPALAGLKPTLLPKVAHLLSCPLP